MPVEGQAPELRQLADELAKQDEGMTQTEAWSKGVCVHCKQPALPNCYSDAGKHEYNISALCEKCFDEMFADDEYDEGEEIAF